MYVTYVALACVDYTNCCVVCVGLVNCRSLGHQFQYRVTGMPLFSPCRICLRTEQHEVAVTLKTGIKVVLVSRLY
jgi:hypothetical protein